MQELSIGELDALILKACRGAGYSWGLSQEAGRAAAWLAVRGLPSADLFALFLDQIKDIKPEALTPKGLNIKATDDTGWQCPVMTGALISDSGLSANYLINTGPVYSPMIMLPFVASVAKTGGTGLCMNIDGAEVHLSDAGELTSTPDVFDQLFDLNHTSFVSVTCFDHADCVKVTPETRRAHVSDSQLETLEALAFLTYVPASDQSRSGAGAGLTDND